MAELLTTLNRTTLKDLISRLYEIDLIDNFFVIIAHKKKGYPESSKHEASVTRWSDVKLDKDLVALTLQYILDFYPEVFEAWMGLKKEDIKIKEVRRRV